MRAAIRHAESSWSVESTSGANHSGAQLPEIRLLIIEHDRLFAEALQLALCRAGAHADVVADALDGIERAQEGTCDVVLLDLELPDGSGLTAGRTIRATGVKVIALADAHDPDAVQEVLRLGFHGYITKNTKLSQFLRSIQRVFEDQVVIVTPAPRSGSSEMATSRHDASVLAGHLTPRERDVLQLMAQGGTGREIARELKITPNTFRSHVQRILVKLQVHSRLEAVVFALDHGVVDPQRRGDWTLVADSAHHQV